MKRLYNIIKVIFLSSPYYQVYLPVLHKLCIMAVILTAMSFTFCEDIMEKVKEYNEDIKPFEVISVEPAPGSSNIANTSPITATFNDEVDRSTVGISTFIVNDGTVTGSFSYDSSQRKITFTPDLELFHNTLYTVEITKELSNRDGISLHSEYSWSFRTEIYYFNVVSVYPPAGAIDVPINSDVEVQFDDNINQTTLSSSILVNGSSPGLTSVTYDPLLRIATYDLASDFAAGSNTVTITAGVKNIGGDSMAGDYTWSFTAASGAVPEIYVESPLGVEIISGGSFDAGSLTTAYTFEIINYGNSSLTINSFSLDNTEFSISATGTPYPIGVGGTSTFDVTFTPSSVGVKNSVLTISSNDSDESSYIINLTGYSPSTPAPEIQITDSGVIIVNNDYMAEFGTVPAGGTGTRTFVIHNIGSSALTISSVSFGWFNPELFTTNLTPQSVPVGGTVAFDVYFKPVAPVNAKATITINNNDADEGSFLIRLKGRGI